MHHQNLRFYFIISLLCFVCIISCNNKKGNNKIVSDPAKMDKETGKRIQLALEFAMQHKGDVDDSLQLKLPAVVNSFYNKNDYENIWSHKAKWNSITDTLINFIEMGELYGLFPKDYQLKKIRSLKNLLDRDSLKRMDADLWTRADLMLTDGFMHLIKDLQVGRLDEDSVYINKKDTAAKQEMYVTSLNALISNKNITEIVKNVEPKHKGYEDLKNCIPAFLAKMDKKEYTYVKYPYKANNVKDSLLFIKTIQKRLKESDTANRAVVFDSTQLKIAIKKFQKKKGINPDGKVSAALVKIMNMSDVERFKRIVITLDRYKQLPSVMPEKYIWVNLPGYYLKVWDHDTIAIQSKIICGKPETRTPLLYSVISDMIIYPTWTVPSSIISKQYLPKLKNNPNYLTGLGLRLQNAKGETVNPYEINWNKYSKGIPFKVVQASGDDNALGIMKFNFNNPYSVYLHDTNQRYLFKNAARALSHGCVRVQQWQELAFFIADNDSVNLKPGEKQRYNKDSIINWLAIKEKRRIGVKSGIPLFIAYFSCEAKDGKIKFYDDIYADDKLKRENYFSK